MAWLEKRGDKYHINFLHGGRHYSRSLKTDQENKANGAKARLEENLADVERGRLDVPIGADLVAFLLSDGKVNRKIVVSKDLTLGELFARYQAEIADGVKDEATRYTEDIHIRHLLRLMGKETPVSTIRTDILQTYVNTRSNDVGWRKTNVSHITIRKEIGSFSAIWNKWALPLDLVSGPAPTKGLVYKKTKAKPPFQTMEQIQRQLSRTKLTEAQQRDLWDSVYLTLPEIEELLAHVAANRFPWFYPMFVFAAHTGARRSEILRSHLDDSDLGAAKK
jgi:integrase